MVLIILMVKVIMHKWRSVIFFLRGTQNILIKKNPKPKSFALSYKKALFQVLHFKKFHFIKKSKLLIKEKLTYFKIKHF